MTGVAGAIPLFLLPLHRPLWAALLAFLALCGPPASVAWGPAALPEDVAALPTAVVVHGRRGPNSEINGVYSRDFSWHGEISPCYRRSGAPFQRTIFLYFEGEWRMGPSPEHGSVWAFAPSAAPSPLHIDAPWEVWDGQRVTQDHHLRVSDASAIPQVLFLSLTGDDLPESIQAAQGMLVQQPGLWDGRPYYQHSLWPGMFLLCSVPEGRWRLGPLPVGSGSSSTAILFAASAASLPQEIVEPWRVRVNETSDMALGDGAIRLSAGPTIRQHPHHVSQQRQQQQQQQTWHPRLLLIEGFAAGDGAANGVYRRAGNTEELADGRRPVYHKTDLLRPASLYFAAGDWRLGPSMDGGLVWAYATSSSASPLDLGTGMLWLRTTDGQPEEEATVADAVNAIPTSLTVVGEHYTQEERLCDARPVYRRSTSNDAAANSPEVFLFFRAHESEWWLGPVVGGTQYFAHARGSRLQVVPDTRRLRWSQPADEPPQSTGQASAQGARDNSAAPVSGLGGWDEPHNLLVTSAQGLESEVLVWFHWGCGLALTLIMLAVARGTGSSSTWAVLPECCHGPLSSARLFMLEAVGICSKQDSNCSTVKQARTRTNLDQLPSELACIVCLEASREILLLPCRHVCCCKACADRLVRCPMCRAWKTAYTKVFL